MIEKRKELVQLKGQMLKQRTRCIMTSFFIGASVCVSAGLASSVVQAETSAPVAQKVDAEQNKAEKKAAQAPSLETPIPKASTPEVATSVQPESQTSVKSEDPEINQDLPDHPHELVAHMTDRLLKKLERFQTLETEAEKETFARSVVDETFAAMVDFKLIARRVMAKHYRYATEEQRAKFATTFRESLINTYALGMSAYSDQKVVIEPFGGIKEGKRKRAKVNMQIHAADGEVYPIEYALYENKEGQWMLENLILNGVNIGLTFRNQFNESLRTHKGSIDAVISNWNSQLDELDAGLDS